MPHARRLAHPSRASRDGRTSGPQALAVLINEALARLGTPGLQPALAGGLGPARITVVHTATTETATTETAPPTRRRPQPRASRALAPVEPPAPAPGEDGDEVEASAGVEAEHVEVWTLVRLAQEGDGDAFGLLYDRYVDSVFRFIYYRVNDRALAEDFTSETFVRALRRISTISYQGRDIGAWFVTIARNIVLDHMKSARHRLEVTTADTIEGPETAESTENAVLSTLDSQRLMAAVAELGDEQRECVMLRFMQGLSVSETAAVMGKNDGAIKALQHRAVRKLASIVGDEI
ncbi:sigma-70 family RNA polymerase sigma factor [Jatrophihabitans endophyticus]|uniref:sigma-70 family RNA polymerase sigma factor n=1 Tax=Jatrophihabitans endophyticus TaxID=1206085 RepID=UPI0026EAE47F|nr:sigma-70 family RNA polymerase sigma factor [Jatrophihabitans endophyticus]